MKLTVEMKDGNTIFKDEHGNQIKDVLAFSYTDDIEKGMQCAVARRVDVISGEIILEKVNLDFAFNCMGCGCLNVLICANKETQERLETVLEEQAKER